MKEENIKNAQELIPQKMQNFLENLDELSRSIITCLTSRKHADIDELTYNTGIPHHEILRRLNGIILPQSKKILGIEVVKFEKARIDRNNGKNIIFSWWIDASVPVCIKDMEVFDSTNRLLLVAEIPGLHITEPCKSRVNYRNGVLQIELSREKEITTESHFMKPL